MLIEVCGVDGSGKSTLVDGVRRRLRETGSAHAYERTLRSESRNLLEAVCAEEGAAVFGVRDHELAVLLDAIVQSGALGHYRGSSVSHAFVTGYRCALAARLDERGLSADRGLVNLVARVAPPDLLLLLAVPVEVALERMTSRRKGDGLLSASDPLREVEARQKALVEHGTRLGAVVLDASLPPSVLVDTVVAMVEPRADA